MALNSPSDLSLGKLGHIAAGNGNSTSETSLNDCARDSGTGETAMWANFSIGGTGLTKVSGVADGSARVTFKIRPKGDVGIYMGNGSDGDYIEQLFNDINGENTYVFEIVETSDGSLYESRIAQNSDNAGDYDATYTVTSGSAEFATASNSPYTDKDRFRFIGGV